MSGGKAFFDTNVLIYAFAADDPRTGIAEALLAGGGVVGVQILNEFVAVASRKLAMKWEEILDALNAIRVLCPLAVPLTRETHERALQIATRHGYHLFDSLVIVAALQGSCRTLYSEAMHDGQLIDGLAIRNPFRT